MDKKNITPNPQQPVERVPAGQLPSDQLPNILAELSEESLGSQAQVSVVCFMPMCSYDGDDE